MPIPLILPISMLLAGLGWLLIFRWYVDPVLSPLPLDKALRPLLLLHSFRYIGLMFLIPGVTAEALDPRFAVPAAYGDLIAALMALATLWALSVTRSLGVVFAWLFNVWGIADLINAVARGIAFTPDGALGAAFWIPAVIVPMLLVSHVYIFVRLLREMRAAQALVN